MRPWLASTSPRGAGAAKRRHGRPRGPPARARPRRCRRSRRAPRPRGSGPRPGSVPWTRASASASRRNASCASVARPRRQLSAVDQLPNVLPGAVLALRRSVDVDAGRRRSRAARRARCGDLDRPSAGRRSAAGVHPVLTRAGVEQRGEQHVARDAGDAVDVEQFTVAARARDPRRDRAGAEPVVDVDDGEPAAHEREHRVQRREAAESRPVSNARRHGDHRS